MRHPDYPVWSFISLVLLLLPAPWHWKARNVSTVCLIAWLSVYHLIFFINSLVWANDYVDRSPVWCDISARIASAVPFAIPLCSLSQMRRLASVASPNRQAMSDQGERRGRNVGEVVLCLVCPCLMMPLLYVVQGHRYDLLETMGPIIPDVLAWPSLVIRYGLPVIIALLSLVYASLATRWFLQRRSQFRAILSGSGLTTGVYLRLLGLAVSDSVLVLFSTLFNLLIRLVYYGAEIYPYDSWDIIHSNFSLISQFPDETQESVWPILQIAVPFYIAVLYAICFFTFFGFGQEAINEYLKIWRKIVHAIPVKANHETPPPTLGSTIVTLTGVAWEDTSVAACNEPYIPTVAQCSMSGGSTRGISVNVERSVV